jgi:S-adenosylmethionine decarboxylase
LVKGTHILINAKAASSLKESILFKDFILTTLLEFNLHSVGEVFHTFDGGGFTCVICLTESHIALHTWPEFNFYTCDIYLCDYSQNNADKAVALARKIKSHFNSFDIKEQIIER